MRPFPGGSADDGTNESIPRDPEPAPDANDQQLARVLICMWSLASGRRLRLDVGLDQLTEDELIAFWADDFTMPSGRHAAPGPLSVRTAA